MTKCRVPRLQKVKEQEQKGEKDKRVTVGAQCSLVCVNLHFKEAH